MRESCCREREDEVSYGKIGSERRGMNVVALEMVREIGLTETDTIIVYHSVGLWLGRYMRACSGTSNCATFTGTDEKQTQNLYIER
jgi:hypothetical protein